MPPPPPNVSSTPLFCGSTLELEITSVAFGGEGIGRWEGRVFFVPFTAVGDRVEVRVTELHARHAKGTVTRVLVAAPSREVAPCRYYGKCGGCQYQHISYPEELRLKTLQVKESFARIAKMPDAPLLPIISSPLPYHYRNRITVHAERGVVGFRSADEWRQLVDISHCMLAMPEVNEALQQLRKRNPKMGHYSLRCADIPPCAFHQANALLLPAFVESVAASLPAGPRFCLELYSGGGLFTERIAERFEQLWAIEQDERLVRDARRRGLPNVVLCEGSVEVMLAKLTGNAGLSSFQPQERESAEYFSNSEEPGKRVEPPLPIIPALHETVVLADPPREGLSKEVMEQIIHLPFGSLVYVSCDPATLARDASKLAARYDLLSIQPIDMFPRTAQIECITVWKARPGTV